MKNNVEFIKGIVLGVIGCAVTMLVILLICNVIKNKENDGVSAIRVEENQLDMDFNFENSINNTDSDFSAEHNLVYNEQKGVYEGTTSGKYEYTEDGYWDGVVYDYYTEEPGGDRYYSNSNISGLHVVTIPSTEYDMDPLRLNMSSWSGVEIDPNYFKILIRETWDNDEYVIIGMDVMNNNYGSVYPFIYGVTVNGEYELDYKKFIISGSDSCEALDIELSKTELANMGIKHITSIEFDIKVTDDLDLIGEKGYASCRVYSSFDESSLK